MSEIPSASPARDARCPVCRSPFRGRADCPRCGADLRPLMRVRLAAWRLRNDARRALRGDASEAARGFARASMRWHATPAGGRLLALAEALCAARAAEIARERAADAAEIARLAQDRRRAAEAAAEAEAARRAAETECAQYGRERDEAVRARDRAVRERDAARAAGHASDPGRAGKPGMPDPGRPARPGRLRRWWRFVTAGRTRRGGA